MLHDPTKDPRFKVIVEPAVKDHTKQGDKPREPKFKGLSGDEIEAVTDGLYIVKDILPAEGTGIMFGMPGSGKTFLSMDLAMSVSSGLAAKGATLKPIDQPGIRDQNPSRMPARINAWFGHRIAPCAVAYVSCEGGRLAQNRVVAWRERHGSTGSFALYPYQVNLSAPYIDPKSGAREQRIEVSDVDALCFSIESQQGKVGIVVIDTLSRAMSGSDENSPVDMGRFIAAVRQIRDRLNCFVLVVHHCGKDAAKGSRGHSSLLAAIDMEMEVVRPSKDEPERIARITKMRDGIDGEQLAFSLEQVRVGTDVDGDPVTTCLVQREDIAKAKVKREEKPLGPNEKAVLRAFEQFVLDYGKPNPGGTGFPDPGTVKAINEDEFRPFAAGKVDGDTTKTKTRKVREAVTSLIDRCVLVRNGGLLWRIK